MTAPTPDAPATTTAPDAPAGAPETPAAPTPPAAPAAAPAAPETAASSESGEQMFPASYVKDLREENARHRTELKAQVAQSEANAKKAAEEAMAKVREEITQSFAKALNLVPEEVPESPEQLLDAATAQAREAQTLAQANAAAARAARVELDAYRVADKAGADPDAVLDSRTFLEAIDGLDPADGEYAAKLAAAVTKAVDANPRLKRPAPAPAAPDRSGGDLSAGPATNAPIGDHVSVDERRKLRAERHARRR
ncbi:MULTISPECIES: hypothetical protein [unclassified Nocardia]|uniref:hypothetical protein n=1 Tax=unclassified Nocardia TaxID=2637762 RepID=UPI00278C534F|nr:MULTISPECIES: hypothetical protein [unclassified Nocardia]